LFKKHSKVGAGETAACRESDKNSDISLPFQRGAQ